MKMHGQKENTKRYSDFNNGKLTLPLYKFYRDNNINSQDQINKYHKDELDILFYRFFEDDTNIMFIYEVMMGLWKEFISRIKESNYSFKQFCAYLYTFVFRTSFLPHKISNL